MSFWNYIRSGNSILRFLKTAVIKKRRSLVSLFGVRSEQTESHSDQSFLDSSLLDFNIAATLKNSCHT